MKFVKLAGIGPSEMLWVNPDQVGAVMAIPVIGRPPGIHPSAKTMVLGAGINLQLPGSVQETLTALGHVVIL